LSDEGLAEKTDLPPVVIEHILDELGIPATLDRIDLYTILQTAALRVAPPGWLRTRMLTDLRLDTVRVRSCPWPLWWQASHMKTDGNAYVSVNFPDECIVLRREEASAVQDTYEKYGAIGAAAVTDAQFDVLAEIFMRASRCESKESLQLARRVLKDGRFSPDVRELTGPITVKDVSDMLLVVPQKQWQTVLDRSLERGFHDLVVDNSTQLLLAVLHQRMA
jgi:hypothetical protein